MTEIDEPDLATILNAKVIKRSVAISGHLTSISLEEPFWADLQRFCAEDKTSLSKLITNIDRHRSGNLSSALRLYVLDRLKKQK